MSTWTDADKRRRQALARPYVPSAGDDLRFARILGEELRLQPPTKPGTLGHIWALDRAWERARRSGGA